jgi:hypothetical protein
MVANRALIDGLPEVEVHQLYRAMDLVVGGDSEARRRFVVVRNPEEAERERLKREDVVAEVESAGWGSRRHATTRSLHRTPTACRQNARRAPCPPNAFTARL